MFGIDLKAELSKALSSPEVRKLVAWLQGKLDRLIDGVVAIERMVAYEHGLPVRDIPPHDPRRLPFVHRAIDVTDQRVNISPTLGKPVTRGEITNIGDAAAMITFIKNGAGSDESVDYLLKPGTTFAFSFFFDAIRISDAGEGAVSVQVLAQ